MSTELHHPDSSQPPDLQPEPAGGHPHSHQPPEWTWQAVTVTCVLVLAAFGFAAALILAGHDARITGAIAVAIVVAIVAVILPSRARGAVVRRVAKALYVLGGGDGGPGGAR